MRAAIAADIFQMDRIGQAPAARVRDEITGLVGAFMNTETLTTVLKHLRHERQVFMAAISIQRGEYLLFAEHFHDFAGTEIQGVFHNYAN
jgi:uncharacterized membrane protein affecting hemolysin expression